jgi:hypothetical protein
MKAIFKIAFLFIADQGDAPTDFFDPSLSMPF